MSGGAANEDQFDLLGEGAGCAAAGTGVRGSKQRYDTICAPRNQADGYARAVMCKGTVGGRKA
ncbi:MAG TPA: hypothetical protein PLL33_05225 [Paracoccus sp. (in: a-proteobacteria)]|nr:hypothetical protein [Paracoccus sp. (in: a-proteobacteria)]